jgi:photosystem II stability/assembly factor-like uncharacterized protein
MKKTNLILRIGLFLLILLLGAGAALIAGETRSLALADLSNVAVSAMTETAKDETLYAALQEGRSGIYRSEDSGRSWQLVSTGPSAPVSALAVHPLDARLLYAGTVDGVDYPEENLWTSENGGRTWAPVALALPEDKGVQTEVSALVIAPDQPGVLYVGTQGQGLYRFYPGNGQHEPIGGATLQNLYVKDLVSSPDSRVYAVTTEGLLNILGSSWEKIDTLPDAAVSLAVDPSNPNTLYAGTVAYGAYRSTDGGQSWEPVNTGLGWQPGLILQVSAIAIDAENPQHLALATAYGVGNQWAPDGIYESLDAGQNWQKVAESKEMVDRLTLEAGGIYAATAEGLVRYGEPLPPASPELGQQLSRLANPSGSQLLILIVTLFFAILVLLSRLTWLPGHAEKPS